MRKLLLGLLGVAVIAAICVFFYANREPGTAADRQLLEAAHKNDPEGIQKALAAGADVNFSVQLSQWDRWFGDPNYEIGDTALHYVTQWGNVEAAKLLIEKGANVNAQNFQKDTPLILAAVYIQKGIAQLLLDHKADPNLTNTSGGTALDATLKKHTVGKDSMEINQLIEAAGGKHGSVKP